jgi:hypothetical protein
MNADLQGPRWLWCFFCGNMLTWCGSYKSRLSCLYARWWHSSFKIPYTVYSMYGNRRVRTYIQVLASNCPGFNALSLHPPTQRGDRWSSVEWNTVTVHNIEIKSTSKPKYLVTIWGSYVYRPNKAKAPYLVSYPCYPYVSKLKLVCSVCTLQILMAVCTVLYRILNIGAQYFNFRVQVYAESTRHIRYVGTCYRINIYI